MRVDSLTVRRRDVLARIDLAEAEVATKIRKQRRQCSVQCGDLTCVRQHYRRIMELLQDQALLRGYRDQFEAGRDRHWVEER
jgi:hypothetical protein